MMDGKLSWSFPLEKLWLMSDAHCWISRQSLCLNSLSLSRASNQELFYIHLHQTKLTLCNYDEGEDQKPHKISPLVLGVMWSAINMSERRDRLNKFAVFWTLKEASYVTLSPAEKKCFWLHNYLPLGKGFTMRHWYRNFTLQVPHFLSNTIAIDRLVLISHSKLSEECYTPAKLCIIQEKGCGV